MLGRDPLPRIKEDSEVVKNLESWPGDCKKLWNYQPIDIL